MKLTVDDVRSRFVEHFDGTTGSVYASPGRINLIGEHTDYNGGFVFPGAVSQGVIAEIKPNGTRKVRAYSIDLKDYVEFSLDDEKGPSATHFRFIFGVCREMMKLGVPVEGFNTAFAGDVPLGAGMSSSAALESTYAFALNDLFADNKIDKFTLAKVGQATEHNYIGCNCGIMDQFASVFGKAGSLMRLDCRSLEFIVCMQVIPISICSSPRRMSLSSLPIGIVAWNIQRSRSVAMLPMRISTCQVTSRWTSRRARALSSLPPPRKSRPVH